MGWEKHSATSEAWGPNRKISKGLGAGCFPSRRDLNAVTGGWHKQQRGGKGQAALPAKPPPRPRGELPVGEERTGPCPGGRALMTLGRAGHWRPTLGFYYSVPALVLPRRS